MRHRHIHIVTVVLLLTSLSCNERITDQPYGNAPPQTFLWLYPETTIGTTVSRQHLRWWGEDPDGIVRGYLFAFRTLTSDPAGIPVPDTLRYTWTSRNDSVFAFPLDTLFRKYVVAVRAVDDRFAGLRDQSIVRLWPFAYKDANDNGLFDAADTLLPTLGSAVDPIGASLVFPIRNTPPSIIFVPNPNDPNQSIKQPDTTFTVATFAWKASDPDGDNTLVSYRIALNDTSDPGNWLQDIPLRDTVVTLVVPRARGDAASDVPGTTVSADVYAGNFLGRQYVGQLRGLRLNTENVLYVQAKDVAGEFSLPILMPSGTSRWYVRKPRSRVLLVSDYIATVFDNPLPTYLTALGNATGTSPADLDVLDIGRGLTTSDKNLGKPGPMVPPFVDPALINTFLLYDVVVWYTDRFPSLGVAQLSLFMYLQKGGRVIFSSTFLNSADPRGALKDFAPIDSVCSEDLLNPPVPSRGSSVLAANLPVLPDSTDPGDLYPQLAVNASPPFSTIFMRPIYRRSDARYVYHLQPDPNLYIGSPNVAVVDGQRRIIFIGLPLHLLNNTSAGNPLGLTAFFAKVLNQTFNPSQHVNRTRY